jgi:3-phenylpropionate/trans-cinnamate dioxygenase ferredoxin subunit
MVEYITVAKVSEVAPGSVKVVELQGHRIAVCNAGGQFYAVSDVCTHDFGPLDQGELEEYEIECPRHGARFDIRTGEVVALPAVLPIDTYPVRVVGEDVQVEV